MALRSCRSDDSKHSLTSTLNISSSTAVIFADNLMIQLATIDFAILILPSIEKLYTKKNITRREIPPRGSMENEQRRSVGNQICRLTGMLYWRVYILRVPEDSPRSLGMMLNAKFAMPSTTRRLEKLLTASLMAGPILLLLLVVH